ncbi:hypothetical protein [Pseudomonas wuhanensis]|uniref:Deaminase of polymorphic toxin system n=1 Tax=Pseudomonas wuhanensis TaxID=2954098 RepID=A0ABY9GWA2_9PSED|nr:hypothetical protein [Pseudomonas sp. FP607]WLI20051.1 hypothetical protein PSH88_08470 [Pseudomonas sp. FP607]
MPSIPVSPTPSADSSQSQSPSHAQKHQGLLDDYDFLLSLMRNNETPLAKLADMQITPRSFSPMALENEIGQRWLQALIQDKDYRTLCTTLNASYSYLTVTMKDGQAIYESRAQNRETTVPLELNKQPVLSDLLAKIEKAARMLGGQIRFDNLFTLARMTLFYGIAPWDPQNSEQREAAIHALEDKRARHSMELGNGIDIDELSRAPTSKERKAYNFLKKTHSSLPITIDEWVRAITHTQIINTVRQFLPAPGTPLVRYLGDTDPDNLTTMQIRARPSVYLEKILVSAKAQELANKLLQALGWFGGKPGEDTAPGIRIKLLVKALRLWLASPNNENPDGIAGYLWQKPSNWGKSYQEIQTEFESHLLTSKRASSVNEAVLIACLYQPLFPAEFQIRDIPPKLPYRSSTVWVNFVHGVYLANAINPMLLRRLSFQQLVDLPIEHASEATAEDLKLITLTRLKPTLEWAVTNGLVPYKADANYTMQEVEEATKKLDSTVHSLKSTVSWLDLRPPERLNIAKLKMAKLFGDGRFVMDGRKLVEEASSYTAPAIRFSGPVGRLAPNAYTFLDVYASGKLSGEKKWLITEPDGKVVTDAWVRIDDDRTVQTNLDWSGFTSNPHENRTLPDIEKAFKTHFNIYLDFTRSAYRTLITHQLASLPLADRQALECGAVKVYTLRKATTGIEAENESENKTLPLRARNGFILEATCDGRTYYYELLPRAGVIRRRPDIQPHHIGGRSTLEKWKIGKGSSVSVTVLRHKTLPFDWDAHVKGTPPGTNAECQAIMDQLGSTLGESGKREDYDVIPQTLESATTFTITNFISSNLLFIDEKKLYDSCYGETRFDREDARRDKVIEVAKMFVPFWGSVDDLISGDRDRLARGVFGIFADLVSFALPVGKFASGSLKLITTAGKVSISTTLPSFAKLTGTLLISTLNPLDGVPSLLKAGGRSVFRLSKRGYLNLKAWAGRAGQYDFVQGMPQVTDPGRWRPLASNDQLTVLRGVEDVPVRNTGLIGKSAYHLIDPVSGKPYGPRLSESAGEVSIGRSSYTSLAETNTDILFDLPEHVHLHKILEVDGRTTLLIDKIPYRLDQVALRRVDVIDASNTLKAQPCRVRRGLGDPVCRNSFVHRELAPTPEQGSYDPSPYYCEWFGDKIYTPAPVKPGRSVPVLALDGQLYTGSGSVLNFYRGAKSVFGVGKKLSLNARIQVTIEFHKGIFGRFKIRGLYEGLDDDMRQVGGLIIESKIDAKKEYLFTQLSAADYYYAEIVKGQSLIGSHRLQRIPAHQLLEDPLYQELFTVFTGSLQANNMARIHGVEKVDIAVRSLDELSIALGTPTTPFDNLKKVKVSTTPGEAVMFDHKTRMIVCQFPESTKTWTRSKEAPTALRTRTAEIFNTLFDKPLYKADELSDLRISNTMKELQSIVKKHKSMDRPRNIAYAEITPRPGNTEVYVSVSGGGGDTRFLPLFAKHPNAKEVKVGDTTYFNIDYRTTFPRTSLGTEVQGQLQSIPRTIDNMATYTPELTLRPTSLDSESKLIKVIRDKYPDDATRSNVIVATTMAPCDSCSVVMQQFAHTGGKDALKVIWD